MKSKYPLLGLLIGLWLVSCQSKKSTSPQVSFQLEKVPQQLGEGFLLFYFEAAYPLFISETEEHAFDTLTFRQDKYGVWHFETRQLKKQLNPYKMFGGDSYEEGERRVQCGLVPFPPDFKIRVLENHPDFFRLLINEDTYAMVVIKKDPKYKEIPFHERLYDKKDFKKDYTSELLSFIQQVVPHIPPPFDPLEPSFQYTFSVSIIPSSFMAFETWDNYLKRAASVWSHDSVLIYDQPEGKFLYKTQSFRSVLQVQGNWMKVNLNDYGQPEKLGWTPWTNKKELLFEIQEYRYE